MKFNVIFRDHEEMTANQVVTVRKDKKERKDSEALGGLLVIHSMEFPVLLECGDYLAKKVIKDDRAIPELQVYLEERVK